MPRRPVDGEKVYGYFGGQPDNWPRDVTFQNVLRKLSAAEVSSARFRLVKLSCGTESEIVDASALWRNGKRLRCNRIPKAVRPGCGDLTLAPRHSTMLSAKKIQAW